MGRDRAVCTLVCCCRLRAQSQACCKLLQQRTSLSFPTTSNPPRPHPACLINKQHATCTSQHTAPCPVCCETCHCCVLFVCVCPQMSWTCWSRQMPWRRRQQQQQRRLRQSASGTCRTWWTHSRPKVGLLAVLLILMSSCCGGSNWASLAVPRDCLVCFAGYCCW